jgi:hypothetical protein
VNIYGRCFKAVIKMLSDKGQITSGNSFICDALMAQMNDACDQSLSYPNGMSSASEVPIIV